jgi:hypothetical protein
LSAGGLTFIPTITSNPTIGSTLLEELNSPVSFTMNGATISVDIDSAVYRTAGGTLDFFYQIQLPAATNVFVEDIGIRSFADLRTVDIAQTTSDIGGRGGEFDSGTQAFLLAQRPGTAGDGIDALLSSGATGGQSTETLMVATSALTFDAGGSIDVAGGGVAVTSPANSALEPTIGLGNHGSPGSGAVAPEPGSLALLATGPAMSAIGLLRRRRRG